MIVCGYGRVDQGSSLQRPEGGNCIANYTNLSSGSCLSLQQERQIGIQALAPTKPIGNFLASLGVPSVLGFEFLRLALRKEKSVHPNDTLCVC